MVESEDVSITETRSLEEVLKDLIRLEDDIARKAVQKPDFTAVVMGNEGAGKSTTVAQLLYSSSQSSIDKTAVANYLTEAENSGNEISKFAWALDKLAKTTNNVQKKWAFETPKYKCTAMDRQRFATFINILSTSEPPDCAIIVVSAASTEYEVGMGTTGHTREDIRLASRLGIKQIIVVVNKMDTQGYSQARFLEIKESLSTFMTEAGYDSKAVPFIPISAYNGDNLLAHSAKMAWYQDSSLVDAIDAMAPSTPISQRPLRIPIEDVFKEMGIGTFAVGYVHTGIIKPGMSVRVAPKNIQTVALSIRMHHEELEKAVPGDRVQIVLKYVTPKDIKRGMVIGDANNDPPKETVSFQALISILPTSPDILVGFSHFINVHTLGFACTFEDLIEKYDQDTGRVLAIKPTSLKAGDMALVKLKPLAGKPVTVEPFGTYPSLGRFALHSGRATVAIGLITEVATIDVEAIVMKGS